MFGNDLMVSPVTQPMGKDTLFAVKKVWLPQGDWIEWQTGTELKGEQTLERTFLLSETPVYVKAGAIIPMQPDMKYVDEKPVNPLILTIFPGSSGKTSLYDDEDNNQNYKKDAYTYTDISSVKTGNTVVVTISPIKGSYQGMLTFRAYELRFPISFPPQSVTVNGKKLPYNKDIVSNSWTYNGTDVQTTLRTDEFGVKEKVTIVVVFPSDDVNLLSGMKTKLERLYKVYDFGRENRWPEWRYPFDAVVSAVQTGTRVTLKPETAVLEYRKVDGEIKTILEQLSDITKDTPRYQYVYELLKTVIK
jgi:hypothetical protein